MSTTVFANIKLALCLVDRLCAIHNAILYETTKLNRNNYALSRWKFSAKYTIRPNVICNINSQENLRKVPR